MVKKYRPNTPHVGVGVIVTNDKGEFLVIKRGDKIAAGYGEWAIPGGGIDYHENFFDAAKRELKEETGLSISGMKIFSVTDDPLADFHWVTITVIGKAKNMKLKVSKREVLEYKWITPGQFPKPVFKPFQQLMKSKEWKRFEFNCLIHL